MTHANKPSPEELRHAFVDLNLTQKLMSLKYGVPENTIKHWLAVANITKSSKTPLAVEATATTPDSDVPEPGSRVGTVADADELRRLYVDLRLSDNQIGPIYGVPGSTVKSWRRRAGLAGARKAEQADSLARFVAEAKARAAAPPPVGRTPRKIDDLPPGLRDKALQSLRRFVGYMDSRRWEREGIQPGELSRVSL